MPWTPPSKMPRSPNMSDLYSSVSVVLNMKGDPRAMPQPSAATSFRVRLLNQTFFLRSVADTNRVRWRCQSHPGAHRNYSQIR